MSTVIITRPKTSIEQTAAVYTEAGLTVLKAPCFDLVTNQSIQAQWLQAPADTWIVLSVHALKHALLIAPDLKPEQTTQVIAVGPAVEKAWRQNFDHQVTSHPLMNSEGVIELLKAQKPNSVKILTTGGGRDSIKRHCMAECISYAQFNTYQRVSVNIDQQKIHELYRQHTNKPVVLTITSCGILTEFMSQILNETKPMILSQPLIVGAQRIAELAIEFGFKDVSVAANPSDEAMCAALINTIN